MQWVVLRCGGVVWKEEWSGGDGGVLSVHLLPGREGAGVKGGSAGSGG